MTTKKRREGVYRWESRRGSRAEANHAESSDSKRKHKDLAAAIANPILRAARAVDRKHGGGSALRRGHVACTCGGLAWCAEDEEAMDGLILKHLDALSQRTRRRLVTPHETAYASEHVRAIDGNGCDWCDRAEGGGSAGGGAADKVLDTSLCPPTRPRSETRSVPPPTKRDTCHRVFGRERLF